MKMVEKGFILVIALAHSGRAGGEDQVLLLGLVDHTVHREAGELLGAGLILPTCGDLVSYSSISSSADFWADCSASALTVPSRSWQHLQLSFWVLAALTVREGMASERQNASLQSGGWAVMTVRTVS